MHVLLIILFTPLALMLGGMLTRGVFLPEFWKMLGAIVFLVVLAIMVLLMLAVKLRYG
jgi:hypothetical protein